MIFDVAWLVFAFIASLVRQGLNSFHHYIVSTMLLRLAHVRRLPVPELMAKASEARTAATDGGRWWLAESEGPRMKESALLKEDSLSHFKNLSARRENSCGFQCSVQTLRLYESTVK